MSFNRLAAIAGFVFVALAIGILFTGVPPAPDAGVDEIIDYISRNQRLRDAEAVLGPVGLLPLALFVAGLWIPFRASDRKHDEGWATSILIGVIALTASIAVHEGALHSLYLNGGEGLDAGVVRGLWDVVQVTGTSAALAMAVIAGSTAVPVLKHRVWPRWHGWLSIVIGVLGVLSLIDAVSPTTERAFTGITFLGFTVVWITATSILLLRGSAEVKTGDQQPVSR